MPLPPLGIRETMGRAVSTAQKPRPSSKSWNTEEAQLLSEASEEAKREERIP